MFLFESILKVRHTHLLSGRVNFGIDSTRRRGLGATILLSLAPRG